MRTGEEALWIAVLLRVVEDATESDERIRAKAEKRLRELAYRGASPKVAWRRALDASEKERREARTWLLKNPHRLVIADWIGLGGDTLIRYVRRLVLNGWAPIGIELGGKLEADAARDRRQA
jgi:hypothetical protein